MINSFGIVIESLVAILLLLTIGYCVVLNKRLKRLRADEKSLRTTIAELVTATESAERAIAGLKSTVHECDANLGERLRTAERYSAEMDKRLESAETVFNRLSRIVQASRPPEDGTAAPDARALAAAAQAFADRPRTRVNGLAA